MRRLVALLCLLLAPPVQAEWQHYRWQAMGTEASLEFWHEGDQGKQIHTSIVNEFARLQALLSPWIEDSELARFNALAANTTMALSPEFYALLVRSRYYFDLSHGAFDITFAGAGHLYDYRAGIAPDAVQLSRVVIGMDLLQLEEGGRASKRDGRLRIDLGGIAKGYAIDRAVALLTEQGVDHAYVSLGGDSHVMGQRGQRPWQVGIRHPRQDDRIAITLPLADGAVSTSGDYERFFLRDGEPVHHILNPSTGRPAGEVTSVTVLAPLSVDADALSTTVFVLGVEKGLALINTLADTSVIIIDRNGKVHYSDDLFDP
ncbi:MAG: FAD:protein FMN transferase [Alcanivoracaceae bacterium]